MKNSGILRISIFYILALLSNIFRIELFGLDSFGESLPEWLVIAISPLQSIGIFIGALIALLYMRKKKKPQYSFFGTLKLYSILIALVPLFLVVGFGFKNNSGISPHIYAILPAISVLIYSFFEEIGWRGYLQDELRNLKQWHRILLIGFLWWFWHLGFIGNPDIINNLTFLAILTAAAFGLGLLIEQT
ncbi:MAG: CPBP family intramembrane metalloprotease, partial [Candidatus Marinimicrobia bacterium]|nr:CPBP family intramembrane metalloprotease [Candidatus Neomarinimicrobiota bacterium]